jgi:3-hydroxyanthranilate 3,4-dioxygenase
MPLQAPFNLKSWIDEHRHLLQPPVGNALMWNGDFMVMIVGGPNQRTDFHVNPGEEFYYQIEGDIVLKVMENGQERDIPIHQGDLFVLPPNVPHSPRRPAGTVGLVLEQRRPEDEQDRMRWYCPKCGAVVHEVAFHSVDLAKQLKPIIEEFRANPALRTCKKCQTVMQS